MAKEKPRYKTIAEFEKEFKKEYSKTMGECFMEVLKKTEQFSHEENNIGKEIRL